MRSVNLHETDAQEGGFPNEVEWGVALEEWMRFGKRSTQGGHPLESSSEAGVHSRCAGAERGPEDFATGACVLVSCLPPSQCQAIFHQNRHLKLSQLPGCKIAVCPFLMKEMFICQCLVSQEDSAQGQDEANVYFAFFSYDFRESAAFHFFEVAFVSSK